MWKTVVLCASLFGSAALGLVTAARWVEPAALPAAGAIGLCLVGIALILISPGAAERVDAQVQPVAALHFMQTAPRLEAMDDAKPVTSLAAATTGPQPTLH